MYNEDALDRPILRKCTQTHGISDELIPKAAFLAIHQNTLRNASDFRGTSIHAIRRYLGKKVDGKSSPLKQARPLVSEFSSAICRCRTQKGILRLSGLSILLGADPTSSALVTWADLVFGRAADTSKSSGVSKALSAKLWYQRNSNASKVLSLEEE